MDRSIHVSAWVLGAVIAAACGNGDLWSVALELHLPPGLAGLASVDGGPILLRVEAADGLECGRAAAHEYRSTGGALYDDGTGTDLFVEVALPADPAGPLGLELLIYGDSDLDAVYCCGQAAADAVPIRLVLRREDCFAGLPPL